MIRQDHESVFLERLGGPVEKQPIHVLAVSVFQNVRVGAEMLHLRHAEFTNSLMRSRNRSRRCS